jgi:hypothetical protein
VTGVTRVFVSESSSPSSFFRKVANAPQHFRQDILLTEQFGDRRPASQWLHETGRARLLKDMAVTADCYILPAVVVVHDKRMKGAWRLATNRTDLKAADIVKLYGKRFTIEETFRDTKDVHFGMGLRATHVGDSSRPDRLLLLGAGARAANATP